MRAVEEYDMSEKSGQVGATTLHFLQQAMTADVRPAPIADSNEAKPEQKTPQGMSMESNVAVGAAATSCLDIFGPALGVPAGLDMAADTVNTSFGGAALSGLEAHREEKSYQMALDQQNALAMQSQPAATQTIRPAFTPSNDSPSFSGSLTMSTKRNNAFVGYRPSPHLQEGMGVGPRFTLAAPTVPQAPKRPTYAPMPQAA